MNNISFPSRKGFISSTVNNTNNNSTTSIKLNSNLKNKPKGTKNNIYNRKMNSVKKKAQLQFSFGDKIKLYKKKIFNQKNINPMGVGIPFDHTNHNTTSQFIKYKYLKPNTSNSNMTEKIIINKTSSNVFMNNATTSNLTNISINKKNIPRKSYVYNINKNHNTKKKTQTQKQNQTKIKSINTNNYIINTLNLSEKNFINNSAQPQSHNKGIKRNFTEEMNKSKKERDELTQIYQKHKKLIEKLREDNKILSEKIGGIENENNKLKNKINSYKDNQEQLVMLVKIIQQHGIDIEKIIDKWNSSIDNYNEEDTSKDNYFEKNTVSKSKSEITDSFNELNGKIDCSSFIPIMVQEKKDEQKIKVSGIPKLNFDIIKNNYDYKQHDRNKNKNKEKNKDKHHHHEHHENHDNKSEKKKDNFLNKSK